jgi:hypothetical protein
MAFGTTRRTQPRFSTLGRHYLRLLRRCTTKSSPRLPRLHHPAGIPPTRTCESRTLPLPCRAFRSRRGFHAVRVLRRLRLARQEGSSDERPPMGDLVPVPSGLGRLTSQSPSTRAGQSWELCYPPQSPRRATTANGSIPTHPAPGRGLRLLLSTPPAQSHPVHPAHSVPQAPMGD